MKKRVLIAEPNRETALALAAAIRNDAVAPMLVHDGDALFSEIEKQTADLVIITAEMPRESGYSLCNRLRSNDRTAGVKVIIVSMRRDDERLAPHRASPRAADVYMRPPLSWRDLRAEAFGLLDLEAEIADDAAFNEVEEDPFAHLDRVLSEVESGERTTGGAAMGSAEPSSQPTSLPKQGPDFSDEDVDGAFGGAFGEEPKKVAAEVEAASDEPELIDDEAILEVPEASPVLSPLSGLSDEEADFVARTIGSLKDRGAPPLPPGIKRKEDLQGPDAKIYQLREAVREKELDLLRLQDIWQRHEKQFSESAQIALEKEVEAKSARMEATELKAKNEELQKQLQRREREYSSSSDRALEEKVLLEKDLIEVVASKEKTVAELRRMLSGRERDLSDLKQAFDKLSFESDATLVETKASYEKQLTELRQELAETRTQAASTEAAVRSDAEQRLAATHEEARQQIGQLQATHESAMAALRNESETTLVELKATHEKTVGELIASHETTVSDLKAAHDKTVGDLTAARDKQLEEIEQARVALMQQHDEERRQADERASTELTRVQALLDDERTRAVATKAELEQALRERSNTLGETQNALKAVGDESGTQKQRIGELEARLEESARNLENKDSGLRRVATELGEVKAQLADREAQLTALRDDAKSKEAKELQQSSELGRLGERLVGMESESASRAAEADTLRGTLLNKESELAQTRDQLSKASSALQQVRDALVAKEGRENELASALGQLNERLKNAEAELATSRAAIGDKEARLEQRLNQKDETLRQRDSVVEQLGREVTAAREEREAVVARLAERLKDRENEIARLSQDLNAAKTVLGSQQTAFDQRIREMVTSLEGQAQAAEARATSAEQLLRERDMWITRSQEETAILAARLESVQRQASDKLDAQMLELESLKQAMRQVVPAAVEPEAPASPEDAMLDAVGKKLG